MEMSGLPNPAAEKMSMTSSEATERETIWRTAESSISGFFCSSSVSVVLMSVPRPDGAGEAIIEQGREVGLLARQLFPDGIEVNGSGGLEAAIRSTRELVANPEVPAIFEGAFEHQGVVVKTDILQRRKENHWRLVEVKSTADLKDHH